MIHSKIFYNYCVWNDEEGALWALDNFRDIDILYDNGGIIQSICAKNNTKLLEAALDYFEKKQFSDKDDPYKEAHNKLVEILEEVNDWIDYLSPLHSLINKYIGYDVARLSEVSETEMLVSSRQHDFERLKEDNTTEERDSRESRKDSDDVTIRILPFTTENLECFNYPYWRLNVEAEESYRKGAKADAICKIQKAIRLVAQNSNTTSHIEHKAMVIYNYLRFTDSSWNEMISDIKYQDNLLYYVTEVLSIATARNDAKVEHDIEPLCSQIDLLNLSEKYDKINHINSPDDQNLIEHSVNKMMQEVCLMGNNDSSSELIDHTT